MQVISLCVYCGQIVNSLLLLLEKIQLSGVERGIGIVAQNLFGNRLKIAQIGGWERGNIHQ